MRVARGQRGVVLHEQLIEAGLSDRQIAHRVDTEWLVRLHQGVYAVGTVGAIGLVQAALFACGPESMAHNATAAALHDLLPYPAAVHVAVPRNRPRPPAVTTYRPQRLPECTLRHGLRTATVPELLLSLAATDPAAAAAATDAAFVARRTSTAALHAFLSDRRGHRGAAVLRASPTGRGRAVVPSAPSWTCCARRSCRCRSRTCASTATWSTSTGPGTG